MIVRIPRLTANVRRVGHHVTLVQTIANPIGNGASYVASGVRPGIAVYAEPSAENTEMTRLWVSDNVIGIAAENQERLFTAFERLHGVEEYPGSGLGLSIAKKGIERLGGRVGVESALDAGSRFWFELSTIQIASPGYTTSRMMSADQVQRRVRPAPPGSSSAGGQHKEQSPGASKGPGDCSVRLRRPLRGSAFAD